LVNGGYDTTNQYFVIINNITVVDFEPIGTLENPFKGKLYGGDHTITISSTKIPYHDNIGLIGSLSYGGLVDGVRVSGNLTGVNYVAGIVGRNMGTITDCINFASINANDNLGGYIGGISGNNLGTITNCINIGNIKGNNFVGGIVGENNLDGSLKGNINGVINLGNLSQIAGTSNRIGGIVGQNEGKIKNVYNYCNITNTGTRRGSIIGYMSSTSSLSDCMNAYNNNDKCILGLIGYNAFSQLPDNFHSYTMYDFLGNTNIIFEEGIMTIPTFGVGYGYMPILNVFASDSTICNYVKHTLFNSGDGTELSPFVINNIEQYNLFANNTVITDYLNTYISLNIDIVTSRVLSNGAIPFAGNFNGNNHNVEMAINEEDTDYLGMWAKTECARISNLVIKGFVHGHNIIGAITGTADGSYYENINNQATVSGITNVGTVIGYCENNCNLQYITNSGNVSGESNVGGIVGSAYNINVTDLTNLGNVIGSNIIYGSNFGGIFGYSRPINGLQKLYNKGTINATKGSNVGGIIGLCNLDVSDNLSISTSMVVADITGYNKVGGLIGNVTGSGNISIGDCAVTSIITAASYTAGFVGIYSENVVSIDLSNGYFNGNLHKLPRSTIVESTFSIFTNKNNGSGANTNFDKIYYNSEILNNEGIDDSLLIVPSIMQGESATSIQLTNINNVSVHSIAITNDDLKWSIPEMGINKGIFASLAWLNFDESNTPTKLLYNYFASGDGTVENPLVITSAQQLYNFSYLHNNYYDSYKEKNYIQNNHILLDNNFIPIGIDTKPFNGAFDGGNYGINNLNINGNANQGLFGISENATISNVGIESGSITGNSNVGAIVGKATATTINMCYNLVNVSQNSGSYVGGLVGYQIGGSLNNSFNAGNVVGTMGNVGGLVGYLFNNATIENCFNIGMVVGSDSNVGGLVGQLDNSSLLSSYCNAYIKTTTNNFLGGLVGVSVGVIKNCYFNGIIEEGVGQNKLGSLVGSINTVITNYLYNTYYNEDFCSLRRYSGSALILNNKPSTEFDSDNFVNSFDENIYVSGLVSDRSNNYTLELTNFANSENTILQNYSKLSARIRIFGWDKLSSADWGTKLNPFRISTRIQMEKLSSLNKNYDYSGNYFVLDNNIDMQSLVFVPIGSYTSAQDCYAFNGTFDGQGYEIQNLKIISALNYVGLFNLLGENGTICNLVIDSNSTISSTGNYVGSAVGRNVSVNGVIDKVISFATVEGNINVGGIVGYTASDTTITNCLFDGTLTGVEKFYGIVGITADSANSVDYNNSWYVFRYDDEATTYPFDYIKVRNEGYLNNGYTNVLYLDKNGDINVVYDFGKEDDEFIQFNLMPNANYSGCVMDVNDNIIADQLSIYSTYNTSLSAIYARFTLPLTITVTGEDESKILFSKEGNGKYYSGQNVELGIEFLEYGYFINIFDVGKNILTDMQSYVFSNESEKLIIGFEMPNTFTDITKGKEMTLPLNLISDYITLTVSDADYNENSHEAQVVILPSGEDIFENIENNYYYGALKTKTTNTIDSGIYEVRSRLVVASSKLPGTVFLGIESKSFTVNTLSLLIDSSKTWANVIIKEYDGLTIKNNVNVTEYFDAICLGDIGNVSILATITWASANTGTDIDITITNFVLQGTRKINYGINNLGIVNKTTGSITIKYVTITLDQSKLSTIYNNQMPVMPITAISLSTSIGTATINYNYTLLDNNMIIDSSWDNVYNVGKYLVGATINDANYNLTLADTYNMEILPIAVHTISYSSYQNLSYDGNDKKTLIKGSYNLLNSGVNSVNIKYYEFDGSTPYDNLEALLISGDIDLLSELTTLINAHSYVGLPSVNNINYQLASDVNILYFNIAKADEVNNLTISLDFTSYFVDETPILNVVSSHDGTFILNKINTSDRGEIQIIKDGEDNKLKFVAYGIITFDITETNCQNYNDRISNQIVLTIKPQTIYLGVETLEYNYGDVLDGLIKYSWDLSQNNELTEEEFSNLLGFTEPIVRVYDENLEANNSYEVKIVGASSKAYIFAKSDKNHILITPREITIVVTAEQMNAKTYGDIEPSIEYAIQDNKTAHLITTLPNGKDFGLVGKLSREVGEDVNYYNINRGTLLQENNPNYDFNYSILGRFAITKREIKLNVPSQSKFYKENDPKLIVELVNGYSFVEGDSFDNILIRVSRIEGENVGSYNIYTEEYNGGNNYNISYVYIAGKFFINKGKVNISALADKAVQWGSKVSETNVSCEAYYLGNEVKGNFTWDNSEDKITGSNFETKLNFIPTDTINLVGASTTVKFSNVVARKIDIGLSGNLDYTYNGKTFLPNLLQLDISNLANEITPTIEYRFNGVPKNVGDYNIYAVLKDNTDIYSVDEEAIGTLHIYPAVINVSACGGEYILGETVDADISYSGFVNGENESILTAEASIENIPSKVGYYSIKASGAKATNYTFNYITTTIIIKSTSIVNKNVKIIGDIPPEVSIIVVSQEVKTVEAKNVQKVIDKALQKSIIKPNKKEMVEYYRLDIQGELATSTQYEMTFTNTIDANTVFYAVNNDGTVTEITDYEINDDGNLVFNAGNIESISMYQNKTTMSIIIDYLPYAGAIIGLVIVIVLIICVIKRKKKINKALRKKYLK